MKRLTKRYPTHIAVACENCVKQDEPCDLAWCYERLLNRLAAYEDTCLEPEEIAKLWNMGERSRKRRKTNGENH